MKIGLYQYLFDVFLGGVIGWGACTMYTALNGYRERTAFANYKVEECNVYMPRYYGAMCTADASGEWELVRQGVK